MSFKITIDNDHVNKDHGGQKISTQQNTFNPYLWNFMICSCVTIYGTYAILVHLSKDNGNLLYSSSAVILLIETLKLVLSLIMYKLDTNSTPVSMGEIMSWRFVLPFSIPAVLYACTNNLGIHLQMEMDPATYQVLSNLKILSTAVLYRIIIKRTLTWTQWLSLSILFIAACQNSIGGLMTDNGGQATNVTHITLFGILMLSLYCTLSGLAGVYSEYILKDRFEVSIHLQNTLLYIFGIIINGLVWFSSVIKEGQGFNLFKGFNVYVWLMVALQAVIGLLMSLVMKHSSNITRLFIISSAALVTTVLSVLVFHLHLNIYFCIAFVLTIVALWLYHRP